MCADQERFVSRWIPSNLNVETRSIAPDEVKRGDKMIEVRELRTLFQKVETSKSANVLKGYRLKIVQKNSLLVALLLHPT